MRKAGLHEFAVGLLLIAIFDKFLLLCRSEVNWSDKLSMGEMQRLSFARLLYHHPNLAGVMIIAQYFM